MSDTTESREDIAGVEFATITDDNPSGNTYADERNLQMVYEIPVRVSAELGTTSLSVRDLLTLGPGSVVELDHVAGEPVDLLVNGVLIGKGDVVVVDDKFGLRITEVVCTEERIRNLGS